MARTGLLVALLLGLSGCSDRADASQPEAVAGAGAEVPTRIELGLPTGSDELGFAPLDDGAELKLQTFGQGGTHVMVAVRCSGFGNRAFISATLRNLQTGVEVSEPAPARPQLLYCEQENVCDLVPYLVHASGLTETDAEKDGLPVELTARVHNEAGDEAETSRELVLSTADL